MPVEVPVETIRVVTMVVVIAVGVALLVSLIQMANWEYAKQQLEQGQGQGQAYYRGTTGI